ncbi:MAG: caspase family protein, partial [Saprospiraceae bacterium]|nr:caspase family protein [Saprospiraceae bacterium]
MSENFKEGFALVIGVGSDLPGTVTDAEAVAKILKDPEKAAYPEDQVLLLTENKATQAGIMQGLDTLAQKVAASEAAGHKATLLVYYSGHGVRLPNLSAERREGDQYEYAFVPNDYSYDTGAPLVSGEAFMAKINAMPTAKSLILIDSCYAGGFKSTKVIGPRKPEPAAGEIANALGKGRGKVIIASSTEAQKSLAGQADSLSLFTEVLMEALQGAATDKEAAYVSVTEVVDHISKAVPAKAKELNYTQTPLINIQDLEPFHVCKHKAEVVPTIPKIFTIYDPKDTIYHKGLQRVLQNYVNFGIIEKWSAEDIIPGDSISASLEKNLKESQIVIPLVSANYFNNETSIKLQNQAVQLNKDIIPIIVNHCPWEFAPIISEKANEPMVNGEVKPVADWDNMDLAFDSIVKKIIKKAKQ